MIFADQLDVQRTNDPLPYEDGRVRTEARDFAKACEKSFEVGLGRINGAWYLIIEAGSGNAKKRGSISLLLPRIKDD